MSNTTLLTKKHSEYVSNQMQEQIWMEVYIRF